MNPQPPSAMSKKAAIVCMAITAISANQQWQAQAFIAAIATVGILCQTILDWRKRDNTETPAA